MTADVMAEMLVGMMVDAKVALMAAMMAGPLELLSEKMSEITPSPCGYDYYHNQRCTRCLYW